MNDVYSKVKVKVGDFFLVQFEGVMEERLASG